MKFAKKLSTNQNRAKRATGHWENNVFNCSSSKHLHSTTLRTMMLLRSQIIALQEFVVLSSTFALK
jgi:hypothetical protein